MKKFDVSFLSLSVLVLALVILGVYQSKEEAKNPVVAKAGNSTITQYDLYAEMKKLYGKQVADELVAKELIEQEAKQQKITVTDEEVAEQVNLLKEQLGSEEAFQGYLEQIGMDELDLNKQLKVLIARDKLLDKSFPVTEEQIQEYYNQNRDSMGGANLEQVRDQIKMILQDANRQANYAQLWADLKEKYRVEWYDPALSDEPQAEASAQK